MTEGQRTLLQLALRAVFVFVAIWFITYFGGMIDQYISHRRYVQSVFDDSLITLTSLLTATTCVYLVPMLVGTKLHLTLPALFIVSTLTLASSVFIGHVSLVAFLLAQIVVAAAGLRYALATHLRIRELFATDGMCPGCGYRLEGLTAAICPECARELTGRWAPKTTSARGGRP